MTTNQIRTEMQAARKAGLEARHRSRAYGCRYVDTNNGICGNEAVDQTGDMLLCQTHMGRVLAMLRASLGGWMTGIMDGEG